MRNIIREIKQNKWWFLYALIVCFYLIIKMYRDIFMNSDSQGGIWNYIQLFFVLLGFRLLFSKDSNIGPGPASRSTSYLIIFSFWSLFIGFASIVSLKLSSLYALGTIPYGALVLVSSIVLGNRVSIDTKAFQWLYISTFIILCIIFFLGRQQEAIMAYFEGAGMVASVYYILCFFPLVFAIKPKWRLLLILMVALCLLMSNKRAGTLAFGVCLFYYFVCNKQTGRVKSLAIFAVVGLVLFYLMNYIVGHYGYDVMGRMEKLEESGGAGRLDRWIYITNALGQSGFFELMFGHGNGSASRVLGGEVHNDFLSVFFEYGIFSVILYVLYFIATIRMWWRMRRENYRYESSVFMLNIITLFLALFSFYTIRPTYITASMLSYGIFMTDWFRQKNHIGIC